MISITLFYLLGGALNLLVCSLHMEAYKVKMLKVNLVSRWGVIFIVLTTLLSWVGIMVHLITGLFYLTFEQYIKE